LDQVEGENGWRCVGVGSTRRLTANRAQAWDARAWRRALGVSLLEHHIVWRNVRIASFNIRLSSPRMQKTYRLLTRCAALKPANATLNLASPSRQPALSELVRRRYQRFRHVAIGAAASVLWAAVSRWRTRDGIKSC
jgi:hypothetical protein